MPQFVGERRVYCTLVSRKRGRCRGPASFNFRPPCHLNYNSTVYRDRWNVSESGRFPLNNTDRAQIEHPRAIATFERSRKNSCSKICVRHKLRATGSTRLTWSSACPRLQRWKIFPMLLIAEPTIPYTALIFNYAFSSKSVQHCSTFGFTRIRLFCMSSFSSKTTG